MCAVILVLWGFSGLVEGQSERWFFVECIEYCGGFDSWTVGTQKLTVSKQS